MVLDLKERVGRYKSVEDGSVIKIITETDAIHAGYFIGNVATEHHKGWGILSSKKKSRLAKALSGKRWARGSETVESYLDWWHFECEKNKWVHDRFPGYTVDATRRI